MALHNDIGKYGEEIAANLLTQKRLKIRERNWRLGHLEMDIIAEDKQTIVFAEVKTRTTLFGDKMSGYIQRFTEDGKITLNLTPVGYKGIMKSESPAAILKKLEEAGGFLPYGDHSDPEEIRREFNMSKKTFKKILGTLFREGKIVLGDDGFRKC